MLLSRKLLVLNTYPSRQLFTSGSGSIVLPQGRYTAVIRGGGGAGGGGTSAPDVAIPGKSGRGGQGKITSVNFILSETTALDYYVGAGGNINGNGGLGGIASDGSTRSCQGGGGGYPSYIFINNTYYHANGGGGGGGSGVGHALFVGTGGGGGGGYYRFENGSIVSVSGANGGNGAAGAGGNGNTQDFPTLFGQRGGGFTWGSWNAGGPGGTGGGAGGGAGTTQGSLTGTAGGGGAGGDMEAGGGDGGYNSGSGGGDAGQQTPTHNAGIYQAIDTTSENADYGVTGNYGSSGSGRYLLNYNDPIYPPTNGVGGFVLIIRES